VNLFGSGSNANKSNPQGYSKAAKAAAKTGSKKAAKAVKTTKRSV